MKKLTETLEDTLARLSTLPTKSIISRSTSGSGATGKRHNKDKWLAKWVPMKVTHRKITLCRDEIYAFCLGIGANPRRGRSLCLSGETGCGKTHAAKAVRRWFTLAAPQMQYVRGGDVNIPECLWISWPDFRKRTVGAYGTIESGLALMQRACEVDLLIIDEIMPGVHPAREDTANLCEILTKREKLWTLETTNVTPDAFVEAWDARVNSRFYRNGSVVVNMGPEGNDKGVPDFSTI